MERDCESELSKLNIEQNACIYHFGASVIHGQRSNILRLLSNKKYFKIKEKNIYDKQYAQYTNSCQKQFIYQHKKSPPSHNIVH